MASTYKVNRSILAISKIYQKGKTQIPVEVRQMLKIQDKDRLLYIIKDNEIVIVKA